MTGQTHLHLATAKEGCMSPHWNTELFFSHAQKFGRPISQETAHAREQDIHIVLRYKIANVKCADWPLPGYARDAFRRIVSLVYEWNPCEKHRQILVKLDAADYAARFRPAYGCRVPSLKPVGNARGFQTKAGWKRVG